jgi:arylsulfatase
MAEGCNCGGGPKRRPPPLAFRSLVLHVRVSRGQVSPAVERKTFKVHLDGYDQSALLSGKGPGQRKEIFDFDAGGNLNAVRYQNWKLHFCVMEGDITEAYRKTPSWPVVVNLRQDPFERFVFESRMYLRWMADKLWTFVPAQQIVGAFLATFREFPPSQKSDSLSVDQLLAKLTDQHARN